jgi:2-C-methyl-D-erythritol 2,4-cyclodiphosphate synthase
MRIGSGWDLHRLVEGRPMILGGVEIPSERGPLGHSDGDVVLHAVTDAILGAAAAGDIGDHFRDSDPKWKDARSFFFVKRAVEIAAEKGLKVGNIDITLVLEAPKLYDHKAEIAANISSLLSIEPSKVSFKAKTMEGLGEVGRGEAVECFAVVLLTEKI